MIIGCLGIIIAVVLLLVYGPMAWGFVLYKFWGWFLTPFFATAFPDVVINQIGYWPAVALFIFMVFFRIDSFGKKFSNEESISALIAPWVILAMGWFLKEVLPIQQFDLKKVVNYSQPFFTLY